MASATFLQMKFLSLLRRLLHKLDEIVLDLIQAIYSLIHD